MKHINYDESDLAGVRNYAPSMGLADLREDDAIILARQLDYVKAQVYEKKLPPMQGLILVPIMTDVPEWAETVTYRTFDQVGMAKIVANYADDLPRADVKGKEITVRVKDLGDSYGYNINEMRAALQGSVNLPTRKADAARRAIDVALNRIAMVGFPEYGLFGLLTHPNIGETVLPFGDWTATGRTADQILADLDAMYDAVRVQSKSAHRPNILALPTAQHSIITSRRLPDSNGMTIAKFFLEKHPELAIEEVPELQASGEAGEDVALMYERSAENLNLDLVMPFNQLPAQPRNLELVVPCLARTAGVAVHYPLALTKGVGI
ncbi:Phage-related protein [plant metagenome]|uniref:Phage-related protein n=1 Tax=plant metagenome TaxID=1297885 RepID=A0A484U2A0_9ZZZZ